MPNGSPRTSSATARRKTRPQPASDGRTVMAVASIRLRALSDNLAQAAGFDARLLAMIGVLILIWLGFDLLTGGIFLTARNLFNLSLQVSVVGIMTCAMVLVIISRQIDLSVGSQLGFIGVFGALVQ